MKNAFGIPLSHIEEKNQAEFNARLVHGNLRKSYLICIIGSFFAPAMFYLDWVRYKNGSFEDPIMVWIFFNHFVFLLFLPIALYIGFFKKTVFNSSKNVKKYLVILITSVFSLALLPTSILAIPGGGTILVYGIFLMLINFVITINHFWRLIINLLCVFLMISCIVYFKNQESLYMVVRILECIGISVPAFAFATFHYNTKVKEFTNTKLLHLERERSETLLLNILPAQTAHELKENGAATPHFHTTTTVLFTDFENFSQQTASLDPTLLIALLNDYFIAFDAICKKYNLEKIKTIGDAYMAVSGLPIANENHAINACNAAVEMQFFVSKYKHKALINNSLYFEMRIGLHSGSLVSGVVGSEKFSFDIWGNTVNIAARMEAEGEVGKVNISASTYELVKQNFVCESRGNKAIKNLGAMEMYFCVRSVHSIAD